MSLDAPSAFSIRNDTVPGLALDGTTYRTTATAPFWIVWVPPASKHRYVVESRSCAAMTQAIDFSADAALLPETTSRTSTVTCLGTTRSHWRDAGPRPDGAFRRIRKDPVLPRAVVDGGISRACAASIPGIRTRRKTRMNRPINIPQRQIEGRFVEEELLHTAFGSTMRICGFAPSPGRSL